jgi:hypothetical protein
VGVEADTDADGHGVEAKNDEAESEYGAVGGDEIAERNHGSLPKKNGYGAEGSNEGMGTTSCREEVLVWTALCGARGHAVQRARRGIGPLSAGMEKA